MPTSEVVKNNQNGWHPRHYHFLAAHVVLYLATTVCFLLLSNIVINLGGFYVDDDPMLYTVWILNGLSLALLFSRCE